LFPKLISIGSFYLPTYGVMVALGFLAGLAVTVRLARRGGVNPELATNLAVYTALGGLLGAKILMLMFDWRGIGEVFTLNTLQAAGVFQGGLILALAVAYFYTKKQGMPLLATADVFAPGVALGHAIGRLGCLAAGCCWGQQCNRFWAITFHNPEAALLTGVPLETPLHPSQLYEAGTEGLLFLALYKLYGRPHAPGRIIGLFLVISSAARFAIEFTRFHEQALPFGLPLSITQWIAIGLALAGVAVLLASRKQAPGMAAEGEAKARPQTA
jgi:phosphatidylglycerol:prolipoprotein diacylglycerol transferase